MLEDSALMRDAGELGGADRRAEVPKRLGSGLLALVAVVTALIVLGALVRAHEAGLACPDWPLCFGDFIPEMDLKVAFEFSHRLLAGSISVVFVVLFVLARRDPESWQRAGGWLLAAALLLGVQILLGALTVWKLLAAWTVTSHLITGNSVNACMWLAASRLRGIPSARAPTRAGLALVLLGLLMLVFQLILGGLVSSTFAGLACPSWPSCNGEAFAPSWSGSVGLHLVHRWNAVLVLMVAAAAAWALRGTAGANWQLAVVLLCGLQVGVGILNVLWGIPVEITGLHSGLAALLVLSQSRATHDAWCARSRR